MRQIQLTVLNFVRGAPNPAELGTKAPVFTKKVRHCHKCGTKLSIYNMGLEGCVGFRQKKVNNYCFIHTAYGLDKYDIKDELKEQERIRHGNEQVRKSKLRKFSKLRKAKNV